MYKVFNPNIKNWPTLMRRPLHDLDLVKKTVDEIFKNVKIYGDKSLIKYSKKFDKVDLKNLLTLLLIIFTNFTKVKFLNQKKLKPHLAYFVGMKKDLLKTLVYIFLGEQLLYFLLF